MWIHFPILPRNVNGLNWSCWWPSTVENIIHQKAKIHKLSHQNFQNCAPAIESPKIAHVSRQEKNSEETSVKYIKYIKAKLVMWNWLSQPAQIRKHFPKPARKLYCYAIMCILVIISLCNKLLVKSYSTDGNSSLQQRYSIRKCTDTTVLVYWRQIPSLQV